MEISLKQLRHLASSTVQMEKARNALVSEVRRAFGPTLIVEHDIASLSAGVNDALMSRSYETWPRVKVSCLVPFMHHSNVEVRKMVARLLPEGFLVRMINDAAPEVRAVVAERVPIDSLREMCERYGDDDGIANVATMRLHEIGDTIELMRRQRMADKVAPPEIDRSDIDDDPMLSDAWYEEKARQLIDDYGELSFGVPRCIERHWNPGAVHRFCVSMKATNGGMIDEKRLQDAVDAVLARLDDDQAYDNNLRQVVASLKEAVARDEVNASVVMPTLAEDDDVVLGLLRNRSTTAEYVALFEGIFKVQKSYVPLGLRRTRLGEGRNFDVEVPSKLTMFRDLDECIERALDKYVDCWNRQQAQRGESITIDWSANPMNPRSISFSAEIR